MRARGFKILSLVCLPLAAVLGLAGPAHAAECWQGWGYWVDAETRTYKSQELLLVTEGPAEWQAGRPITLRVLDRSSGAIDPAQAPIVAVPLDPRAYYRGGSNYVDGLADVQGARDRLVFGLSHVAPPASALPEMEAYTAWACGRGRQEAAN